MTDCKEFYNKDKLLYYQLSQNSRQIDDKTLDDEIVDGTNKSSF